MPSLCITGSRYIRIPAVDSVSFHKRLSFFFSPPISFYPFTWRVFIGFEVRKIWVWILAPQFPVWSSLSLWRLEFLIYRRGINNTSMCSYRGLSSIKYTVPHSTCLAWVGIPAVSVALLYEAWSPGSRIVGLEPEDPCPSLVSTLVTSPVVTDLAHIVESVNFSGEPSLELCGVEGREALSCPRLGSNQNDWDPLVLLLFSC